MSETLRIAAFDIGTNKIVGAVAERTDDGHLSILAIEEEINKNGIVNRIPLSIISYDFISGFSLLIQYVF